MAHRRTHASTSNDSQPPFSLETKKGHRDLGRRNHHCSSPEHHDSNHKGRFMTLCGCPSVGAGHSRCGAARGRRFHCRIGGGKAFTKRRSTAEIEWQRWFPNRPLLGLAPSLNGPHRVVPYCARPLCAWCAGPLRTRLITKNKFGLAH
jgi:hypothetical protein